MFPEIAFIGLLAWVQFILFLLCCDYFWHVESINDHFVCRQIYTGWMTWEGGMGKWKDGKMEWWKDGNWSIGIPTVDGVVNVRKYEWIRD